MRGSAIGPIPDGMEAIMDAFTFFVGVVSVLGIIAGIAAALAPMLNTWEEELSGVKISYLTDVAITPQLVGWTVGDVRDRFIEFEKWAVKPDTPCQVNEELILERELYEFKLREGDHLRFVTDVEREYTTSTGPK